MIARLGAVLLVVAVAALALGWNGVAAERAAVETRLHPGWNLVGWLEEPEMVGTLFQRVHGLESVQVEETRPGLGIGLPWRTLTATSGESVRTGDVVWLRIGGAREVTLRQEPSSRFPSEQLPPGWNAVVWAWGGELWPAIETIQQTAWEDDEQHLSAWTAAGAVVGAQLRSIWRWNAREQRFETHRRGDAPAGPADAPLDVQVGEGLLIELAHAANWGAPLTRSCASRCGWLSATWRRSMTWLRVRIRSSGPQSGDPSVPSPGRLGTRHGLLANMWTTLMWSETVRRG